MGIVFVEDSSKNKFGGGQMVTSLILRQIYPNSLKILIDVEGAQLLEFKFGPFVKKICVKRNKLVRLIPIISYLIRNNSNTYILATKSNLTLLPLLWLSGARKVIYYCHVDHGEKKLKNQIANALIYIFNPKIICVSNYVAEYFHQPCFRHLTCDVLYNPIRNFHDKPLKILFANRRHFFFVGSLVETKGIDILCRIFDTLPFNIKLDVFGTGKLADALHKSHENSSKIQFHGFCDDPYKNVTASSTLILPSTIAEACPMVLLEAIARGIPCITTPLGGQAEIAREFGGCLLSKGILQVDLREVLIAYIQRETDINPINSNVIEELNLDKFISRLERLIK